jgi:dimethylhistidine N-methyltransferase
MLEETAVSLLDRYEGLEVRAIASEYHEGLRHVRSERERPKLIAWLGSSIGNLSREEAGRFLSAVRQTMTPEDRALIGIDLRKSRASLEAAYDDAEGVTARFSLNLLERINRELDADFDLEAFRHEAVYLEDEGRVKICIVSQREQRVALQALGLEVDFAAGEGIHTENAFKYSPQEIDQLAGRAGLAVEQLWRDEQGRYSLSLLAPA